MCFGCTYWRNLRKGYFFTHELQSGSSQATVDLSQRCRRPFVRWQVSSEFFCLLWAEVRNISFEYEVTKNVHDLKWYKTHLAKTKFRDGPNLGLPTLEGERGDSLVFWLGWPSPQSCVFCPRLHPVLLHLNPDCHENLSEANRSLEKPDKCTDQVWRVRQKSLDKMVPVLRVRIWKTFSMAFVCACVCVCVK